MSYKQSFEKSKNFKRMALKDKLILNKKISSLSILSEQLRKNQETKTKLEQLLLDETKVNTLSSGSMLSSQSWVNNRIRDELKFATNKCENIQEELNTLKKDFSLINRMYEKKREKAKNYAIEGKIKKIEKDDIETMSIRGKIKGM